VETIRSNVIGCLNLADVTKERGIHMTYYGTGCIFHYDDKFPQGSGKGFKESDTPNFTGSYYSYTKVGYGGTALCSGAGMCVQLVMAMVLLAWPGNRNCQELC
jgi:dTDP-4-dehydrorhamnose reductase